MDNIIFPFPWKKDSYVALDNRVIHRVIAVNGQCIYVGTGEHCEAIIAATRDLSISVQYLTEKYRNAHAALLRETEKLREKLREIEAQRDEKK